MTSVLAQALDSATAKSEHVAAQVRSFLDNGSKAFVTSSFQTHSLPLLHILAQFSSSVPVLFLNTGYHFPETLRFRDQIVRDLSLSLVDLRPNVPKSEQRTSDGRLLFAAAPTKCCYLNKIEPLEGYLRDYDVWISGVRAEQTDERSAFSEQQPGPHGTLRYHPMLDWTAREIYAYRKAYDLPHHPLEGQGYLSVGCMPCTVAFTDEAGERDGRWVGQSKTECGLHTELATRSK